MYQPRKFRLTASVILCFLLQAQGADKYTDENRPYEFGFKIDGQQHRHESKDKDGIIMGEFGFITADDVYHVTVYATDKEGRFKILSMKNIHLKSSPASNPRSPITSRQGHALALPPAPPASVQAATVPQPEKPFKPLEPPGKSCSSCSLPTTTTQSPPPVYNQANSNGNYNSPGQFDTPGANHQQTFPISSAGQPNNLQPGLSGSSFPQSRQPGYSQQGPAVSQSPQQTSGTPYSPTNSVQQSGPLAQNYPSSPSYTQGPSAPNLPNNYAQPEISSQFGQNPEDGVPQPGVPQAYPGGQNTLSSGDNSPYAPLGPYGPAGSQNGLPGPNSQGGLSGPNSQGGLSEINSQGGLSGPNSRGGLSGPNVQLPGGSSYPQGAGGRTSKQYNGPEQQFNSNAGPYGPQSPGSAPGAPSVKPTLVSAQMQIVDKNTDIHSLSPGEKEGLPPGLTKNDMTQLLYTFNYTVGFHGHFEEGYTNGVKQGYYYVTGRNGVRTRIDYVADDTGFHPKVSQDVLDLLSDDVPKPETEKDAKFGLKGYEFKWLYYPVDS